MTIRRLVRITLWAIAFPLAFFPNLGAGVSGIAASPVTSVGTPGIEAACGICKAKISLAYGMSGVTSARSPRLSIGAFADCDKAGDILGNCAFSVLVIAGECVSVCDIGVARRRDGAGGASGVGSCGSGEVSVAIRDTGADSTRTGLITSMVECIVPGISECSETSTLTVSGASRQISSPPTVQSDQTL